MLLFTNKVTAVDCFIIHTMPGGVTPTARPYQPSYAVYELVVAGVG